MEQILIVEDDTDIRLSKGGICYGISFVYGLLNKEIQKADSH